MSTPETGAIDATARDEVKQQGNPFDYEGLYEDCLYAQRGNEAKAREMYTKTLQFREQMRVDTMFEDTNDLFEWFKAENATYGYGRSREGGLVSYEMVGLVEPSHFTAKKVTDEQMLRAIMLHTELTRIKFHAGTPPGTNETIAVFDFTGYTISKAMSSVQLKNTRLYIEAMVSKQPYRLGKILCVSSPPGASIIQKLLTAILPGTFASRIVIIKDMAQLDEYIDPAQRPVAYGGTNEMPMDQTEFEQELRAIVRTAREKKASGAAAGGSSN